MRPQTTLAAAALAAIPLFTAFAQPAPKLNPGYHHPDGEGFFAGPMHDAITQGLATHTLQTLPNWTHGFTVAGTPYSYTLLGTNPASGPATTIIPTILVPIRLTIPDKIVGGVPLVLDATPIMPDILHSPIFTPAKFDTGMLQFADAMLHAEFPQAPHGWHLTFSPSVAPTLDITAPAGGIKVLQSKSGRYLGLATGHTLDGPIFDAVRRAYSADTYVVFITYNALDEFAFGYHSNFLNSTHTANTVFTYTSWLVGVNDLFTLPSPNADTFAHEIAESVHDPFGTSRTREWGDWFNRNKCFQNYIEVGDAVEDAPATVQNYRQKITINGRLQTYTLQTEALLPWFEREFPSTAMHQAYSFPGETVLLGPAPLNCSH